MVNYEYFQAHRVIILNKRSVRYVIENGYKIITKFWTRDISESSQVLRNFLLIKEIDDYIAYPTRFIFYFCQSFFWKLKTAEKQNSIPFIRI